MSDFILISGDIAIFNPVFGLAIVMVKPGTLRGNGKTTLKGKKICVDGDEKNLFVFGINYITPIYSIPGIGMLKINALGGDQKAMKTRCGGKPVLLKGSNFIAKFEVLSPAMTPPAGLVPPIPDAIPQYVGSGSFISTNTQWKGT